MNTADIKETFYKRYGRSDRFLHYAFTGSLCTLLGHDGAPYLSCALSMGVGMFARSLGADIIKIQDVNSDRLFSYNLGTPPEIYNGMEKEIASIIASLGKYNLCGAEILYSSSVPPSIQQKTEFERTLINAVAAVCGIDEDIASVPYPKSGYCAHVCGDIVRNYPLPLTGYKIVLAHCRAKNCMKDVSKHTHHLAGENQRIENALRSLEGCSVKGLLQAMNASQNSLERYRRVRGELFFLARCARDTEGVRAVRCNKNGAVLIIENDYVDYAVNIISNDFENNIGYKPTFCIAEAI